MLLVGMAGLYLATNRTAPPWEGWGTDYALAMRTAATSKANVLVGFYMDGCAYCDAMDRDVLNQPAVETAMESYIPVRVDIVRHRELAGRLGAVGAPTYAALAADGTVLGMTVGYQPAETFIKFLQRAAAVRY